MTWPLTAALDTSCLLDEICHWRSFHNLNHQDKVQLKPVILEYLKGSMVLTWDLHISWRQHGCMVKQLCVYAKQPLRDVRELTYVKVLSL